MSVFGKNLKRAMANKNLTQKELSVLSGIGKSSISQYLSGKNVPNVKSKERLAEILEVPIDFFDEELIIPLPTPETIGTKSVTIAQAAQLLGKSPDFVRVSLRNGAAPFGFATKGSGSKWIYHISPKKFFEYIGINDEEAERD